MDPTQRVKDLIIICQRLRDLLTQENALLRSRQPAAIEQLLDDKGALCRAYETRVAGMLANRELLAEVEPETCEQLRELGDTVNGLIAENARLLEVAMEAHRRVMQVIADVVSSSQPGPSTYAPASRAGDARRNAARRGAALTFNQAL